MKEGRIAMDVDALESKESKLLGEIASCPPCSACLQYVLWAGSGLKARKTLSVSRRPSPVSSSRMIR